MMLMILPIIRYTTMINGNGNRCIVYGKQPTGQPYFKTNKDRNFRAYYMMMNLVTFGLVLKELNKGTNSLSDHYENPGDRIT